jgi:ABC-type molybdate transport system permease subunit
MREGMILLILIALAVAYLVARTRRRMGMLVTSRTWLAVMLAVVLGVLALWAAQRR